MDTPPPASSDAAPRAVPEVHGFHDARTGSVQYLVADPATRRCGLIDPVLDFDESSAGTATRSADALLAAVRRLGLTVEWVLDTHPHADHLSAAAVLRERTGAPILTGERVTGVQRLWSRLYGLPDLPTDGRQWDRLLADGETLALGSLRGRVLLTPGHTLCSVALLLGDAAFVHDTLFMPHAGTARADFPGGDARELWRSIGRILALPDGTRLFTGHDYPAPGQAPRWESTVAAQRAGNPHVLGQDEDGFVRLRTARDRTLPLPRLMLAALQVNINGGRLPAPEADGRRYLRIPLDAFPGAASL